jgi:hypothetical protein
VKLYVSPAHFGLFFTPTPKYFPLMWIGFAAASGMLIDVPIITQRLVRSIKEGKPISLEMMLTLDAGNHHNHPTGIVEEYLADWWTVDVPPKYTDILNIHNLPECLQLHRKQKSMQRMNPGTERHTGTTSRTHIGTDLTIREIFLSYRQAAVQSLHHLRQLGLQIQAKEVGLENQCRLTMRRASAFNQLFEAAVVKETSHMYISTAFSTSGTGTSPADCPANV